MSDKNRLGTALLVCCLLCCMLSTVIISTALTDSNVSNNNTTNCSTNSTNENSTVLNITNKTNLSELQLAPLNPAFVEYQKQQAQLKAQKRGMISEQLTTYESGLVPSPIDLSYLSKISDAEASTFNSSYDLRNSSINKVTAIGNQGDANTCWSFATYGSMESFLMPNESRKFSENNMVNILSPTSPIGFDVPYKFGDMLMSTAYLTRWSGPVNSIDDPYIDSSGYLSSELNYATQKHIQDIYFIPKRDNSTDNNAIKWAIQKYGAVATYMHMERGYPYYNSITHSFYYNDITQPPNHAVDIIGWDDNYSMNNFTIIPPGNGAFIVKNSWNTDWGDNGYFYVSYYDSLIGNKNSGHANNITENCNIIFTAENETNYKNIYQHDLFGWTRTYGTNNNLWCKNVFNANSNEMLKAVSFYATDSICNYKIYIQIGQDVPILTNIGTLSVAGYHTIPLNNTILLKSNKQFSIILNLNTPNYNHPIAVECPLDAYNSRTTANASESFIGTDINTWTDITTLPELANTNICIKAFTDNVVAGDPPADPIAGAPTAIFTSNVTNGYAPLIVQFNDTSVNETTRTWDFGDGSSSIEANPVHVYNTANNYTVTLTASNGTTTNSTSSVISVFGQRNRESPVYAYVTNSFIGTTVQVVDIEKNAIVSAIPVGSSPKEIAISKDRQTAYVTNGNDGTVSVINAITNTGAGSIFVGLHPYGIAITPDKSKVYVTHNDIGGFVSVINTATNAVSTVDSITGAPWDVAITPDGTKAYIALSGANNVSVINTANDQVKTTIRVGSTPKSIAISPDGKIAYVANTGSVAGTSNTISVINTVTDTVITTLTVGSSPDGIAISPDGRRVYVANFDSSTVSVIDTITNTIIATIQVGAQPIGIAISPDGRKVCTSNANSNTISVINTTNNAVVGTVPVGFQPNGIAINSQPITSTNIIDFTVTPVSSQAAPFVVYFNGAASQGNINNMHWDFGDGKSINSNNVGATIANSYASVGMYTVTLTVTYNDSSTKNISKNVNVVATPHKPINADFTGTPLYGISSLNVQFMDNSTGANNWYYLFGDNGNAIAKNPAHSYTAPGSYSVVQIAFNTTTSLYDAIVKKGYINVADANGIIPKTPNNIINVPTSDIKINDFTANVITGSAPLNVVFNSNVTGLGNVRTWTWIFEPVSGDYYSTNAVSTQHTFTHVGKFDITLILTNKTGAVSSMTKTAYITVTTPNSGFNSTGLSSGNNNGLVDSLAANSLTNAVTPMIPVGAVNINNSSNPTNIINSSINTSAPVSSSGSSSFNGLYGVSRSSEYSSSTPSTTFTVYGHVNSEINFEGTINTEFTGVAWNFQDGKGSHGINPTHIYTKPGIYAVTLTAINTKGESVKKVVGKVIIE